MLTGKTDLRISEYIHCLNIAILLYGIFSDLIIGFKWKENLPLWF